MRWARHPILCLFRAAGQPLRRYLAELMVQEGYFCTDVSELDTVNDLGDALAGRALVLVSASTLTPTEITSLSDFVREGGRTVLMRPPADLVHALGLTVRETPHRVYGEMPPGYIRIADHRYAGDHAGTVIQTHVPTDLWQLGGVRPLAHAAMRRDEPSSFAAVVEADCGEGRAGIFFFEPGESVVLTRQGDPRRAANSPWPHADAGVVKPGTLFIGHLDPDLREIPQADVLADLLVGVIRGLTDDILPLPRVWHMPDDSPALTLLDGDSDVYDWDAYGELVSPCRQDGIPYTLNLMPAHLADLDRAAAESWLEQGSDFQLHYRYGNWRPSLDDIVRAVPEQQALFRQVFGRPSVGSRAHSCLWPGYTEPAEIYAAAGARMETNFMPFRGCQYGYCGSARAGRFMTADGRVLPISQQPTVFMDDTMSNEKALLPARSPEEAYDIVTRVYAESVTRHHGVICTCLHPVSGGQLESLRRVQTGIRRAVIDATVSHRLQALTVGAWSAFHEARRTMDVWLEGNRWLARTQEPIANVTFHIPNTTGVRRQGHGWTSIRTSLTPDETTAIEPG